ncbi:MULTISPECIES: Rieske 2Fe-2S domain-containing protein [Amycolatopsis]|uniref:Rieske 2Fe-2S domain-containing protein n=1 Tax=Amycolatopsis albidoflavus TaxID=102226 RepID=A0ABW5I812_9PSEU
MNKRAITAGVEPVPDFGSARTRHQRARAAGLDPDYWYPVEFVAKVKPGQVVEVVFWNKPIAVFRGEDGVLRAIDNRCAHRQLKLSEGKVVGCELACLYHGWRHDGQGNVSAVPHDLFGHRVPKTKLDHYPVREEYGLIWLFPGDPARSESQSIPVIPELADSAAWHCVPVDVTWRGHHSMIIDNVSDFTHAYLHRKYRPFTQARMTSLSVDDQQVAVSYRTQVGGNRFTEAFLDPHVDRGSIRLCYQYPYQWSDTGGKIKHWCFVLPVDERTTRCFFVFLFAPDLYRIPLLPVKLPRPLVTALLKVARRVYLLPLLDQDRVAIEAEQRAHERHHQAPIPEVNPAVTEFQRLTINKWAQYVGNADRPPARRSRQAATEDSSGDDL